MDCLNYDQRNTISNSSIGFLEISQSSISLHQSLLIQNSRMRPGQFDNGIADDVKGGVHNQKYIADFIQNIDR